MGEVWGKVAFEWVECGFFLIQDVDLEHHGQRIEDIEIIEEPPPHYTSGEEEPLGYGPSSSSSSGGPVGQREEEAKEEV